MRKLIEKSQKSFIVCDNWNCKYEVSYSEEQEKRMHLFINKPCPNCGENLLTFEDYITHKKIVRTVNFINKWFSWITVFYSKKSWSERQSIEVYTHDGVKVKDKGVVNK